MYFIKFGFTVKLSLHLKHTVQAEFYQENSIQFCKIFWHFKLLELENNILTSFGLLASGGTWLVLHHWLCPLSFSH